jgi:hypothetical protein
MGSRAPGRPHTACHSRLARTRAGLEAVCRTSQSPQPSLARPAGRRKERQPTLLSGRANAVLRLTKAMSVRCRRRPFTGPYASARRTPPTLQKILLPSDPPKTIPSAGPAEPGRVSGSLVRTGTARFLRIGCRRIVRARPIAKAKGNRNCPATEWKSASGRATLVRSPRHRQTRR